jgi:hypothetical protein
MEKVKLIALVVFVVIVNQVWGQELKSKSIGITCEEYPQLSLPSYVSTYFIKLKGLNSDKEQVEKIAKQTIVLNGLKKVEKENEADITVILTVETCRVQNKRIVEANNKDPFGNPQKSYQYVFTFTWPLEVEIVSNKYEGLLFEKVIHKKETVEEATESFLDKNTLSSAYIGTDGMKTCIGGTLKKMTNQINVNITKSKTFDYYTLFLAKGKKLNYDDLDLAFKKCKDGFKPDVKKETDPVSMQNFQDALNIWKKALGEADTSNSLARINKSVYYGINYNMALAYFGMKDFDNAWKYLRIASKLNAGELKESVKKVSDLMSSFESGYYLANPDIKVSEVFYGKWKLVKLQCDEQFDLNGDGKSSFDILSEYNECRKDQVFEFGPEKAMVIYTGKNNKDCDAPKESKLFWGITKNKMNERKYLKWDRSEKLENDVSMIMGISYLTHNRLVINGDMHIGGDTSSGCILTFEKIMN